MLMMLLLLHGMDGSEEGDVTIPTGGGNTNRFWFFRRRRR